MTEPVTLEVRNVRGRIVPCQGCKKVYKCAMYHSLTRHRLRHGEYSQGTNILHMCSIYEPDKKPQNIKAPHRFNRTSGKEPT